MSRRRRLQWIAAGLFAAAASCADREATDDVGVPDTGPEGAPTVIVTDDAGRFIELSEPPRRIVSLVPSATEILVALGQYGRLVGRTDFDTAPEVRDLPSVGGGLGASVERIVRLEPDLVVHFLAPSDPDTPRQLEAAGLEHLAIRPDRIDDIRRIVSLLGAVVDREERADSLTTRMDEGLGAVAASVEGLPKPNVALLGGDPPTAAGPGTFLHELLDIGGGRNVFSDLQSLYAPISIEEILRREVDLILAPAATPIPTALSSIPVGEIPLDVLLPGLGVVRSAEVIADLLHPDRVP